MAKVKMESKTSTSILMSCIK